MLFNLDAFALIYYQVHANQVLIIAVLDSRISPEKRV
jgi:hypothetical protein